MRKATTIVVLIAALTAAYPVIAKVTMKPLEPAKGKVLLVYELRFDESGVSDFVFPPGGGLTSLDRKPIIVSVKEKKSGEKLKATLEPYIKGEKTIPGKYEFHIRLPGPLKPGEKIIVELSIIIFNKPNCYGDKNGLWVCEYSTRQNTTFLVPKGHTPVFSSHPVRIFEEGGIICLQTDTGPADKERVLVFKTEPPPKQEGMITQSDTNDLITEANDL